VPIYEVTARVAPDQVARYEEYMTAHHIPALLATGRFRGASMSRSEPGRYRMCYETADAAALQRYLTEEAPALREEFTREFPAGVSLERETWEIIRRWP
jgi:hypothetical protein